MNMTEKAIPEAVSLNKILLATDFSDSSFAALPYAGTFARRYSSKIYLAHVIVAPETAASRSEQIARRAKEQLAELSRRLEGIPNEFVLAYGDATDALIKIIKEHKIDLVVVGTHGRHGFTRFLLGSIAEEVFRMSPCPVLTVGPHLSGRVAREIGFKSVLYPTDLLKESFCAAPYAVSLASEYGANLTLLYVLPEADATRPDIETVKAAFRDQMKRLIPAAATAACKTEAVVELGGTAETILTIAKGRQADLIVLGVREAGPSASYLRGNIAYRVVVGAECPVLTVRENLGREGQSQG